MHSETNLLFYDNCIKWDVEVTKLLEQSKFIFRALVIVIIMLL